MTALSITGLAKRFGPAAVLQDVALNMPGGELVAILGASGSGKTTLLRLICGFERADAGRIAIAGEPVCDTGLHVAPERRHVGYVAQEGALFPHLTVGQNIAFGLPRAERRAARGVAALLELVGLPAVWAARPPHELSGGEQQRVALARALAPRPRLVLLDEPFSALDAALRADTRQAVAGALAAAGATALLVTHDQSEALSMGHRVGVLRRGRLVQLATPEALYRRPADAELARFVGDAVLLPGTAADGWATCPLGRLPLAGSVPDGPVTVLVRPEQVLLGSAGVPARVTGVTFYGHDAAIDLQLEGAPRLAVSARVAGYAVPHVGDAVTLAVAGTVLCFPELQ